MSDDHARAAEIDRLVGALGWTKGLLAQAQRDRKAAQTLLNMERERADKAEAKAAKLQQTFDDFPEGIDHRAFEVVCEERDELEVELKLLRGVAEVADCPNEDKRFGPCSTCDFCVARAAWRAYAPKT